MSWLIILLCVTAGSGPSKEPPGGQWIIIIPEPPPKSFIEKTWPHWEKPWPSNQVPFQTPFRMAPLQVV